MPIGNVDRLQCSGRSGNADIVDENVDRAEVRNDPCDAPRQRGGIAKVAGMEADRIAARSLGIPKTQESDENCMRSNPAKLSTVTKDS